MNSATPMAPPLAVLWSKHRVEALTDGIFAVAMTLLVIELKIPDPHFVRTEDQLTQALIELVPKALSWVISFLMLSIFWISHHRLFHYVRYVDSGLLWRNLYQLMFVALMPFSAAMVGEFGFYAISSVAYNGNMVMLGLLSLWKVLYIRRHPELTSHPMERGTYHGMLLRIGGLMAIGLFIIAATLLLHVSPLITFLYLLMIPIGIYSRRLEARARAAADARPDHHITHHP